MGFVALAALCGGLFLISAQVVWLAAVGTEVEGTVTHTHSYLGTVGAASSYDVSTTKGVIQAINRQLQTRGASAATSEPQ